MPHPAHAAAPRLHLYGEPAVVLPDGGRVALERRAAALLAMVALEPGIGRSRVASWLWPESGDARRNLRQQLLRFRRQFGHPLVQGGEALSLGVPWPDAAADPWPGTAPLLDGHDYDDCEQFDRWLQTQRRQQRVRAAKARGDALAKAEAEQRWGEAIDLAHGLLAEEPLAEVHHRTLIRLHYLHQDSASARAAFLALRRLLQREFDAEPSAETLALMRLVDQTGRPAPTPNARPISLRVGAIALRRPPRMVGRARELHLLRATLDERRALLLLGEAGMGKSRLLAEGLEAVAGQVLVKAQAGDAGVPYALLARLLRQLLDRHGVPPPRAALNRLLPEFAAGVQTATRPAPADGDRLMLQAAVEQVIDHSGVGVVAVDDLHFADQASLEMLGALVGSERLTRLAWAFTQRPGEGSAAALSLRDTLEEARRLEVASLAPLDAAQMTELVQSLGLPDLDAVEVGARLLRHTGGNPLFALETLKQMMLADAATEGGGLALPQPSSVGALIDRRLRQLSDGALALARVAAIAGRDFSPALAEAVLGRRAIDLADAWGELEAAQVLREQAFAHDLVLEAAQRSVPKAIAAHLHAAVAQHLERCAGEAADTARHWLAAGDEGRAWPQLLRAAEQARSQLRPFEEAEFLRLACGLDRAGVGPADRFELLMRLHRAEAESQGAAQALRTLDRAEALSPTDAQRTALLAGRAALFADIGDYAQAIEVGEQAMGLAVATGQAGWLADSLATVASACAIGGQPHEAEARMARHWSWVEQLDPPSAKLYGDRAIVLDRLGRPLEARPLHLRAIDIATQQSRWGEVIVAHVNLSASMTYCGEIGAADATLQRAEALHAQAEGLAPSFHFAALQRANSARDLGRYTQAMARFDAAFAASAAPATLVERWAHLQRALLWMALGQWARAQQDLALLGEQDLPAWALSGLRFSRARMAMARGHRPDDGALRAAEEALPAGCEPFLRLQIEALRWTASAGDGPAQARRSLAALEGLVRVAQAHGFDGLRLQLHGLSAQVALAAGARAAARGHALHCQAASPGITPRALSAAVWWHGLWRVWQALNQAQEAQAARAEGLAWLHRTLQHELASEWHASFREAVPAHRELLAG